MTLSTGQENIKAHKWDIFLLESYAEAKLARANLSELYLLPSYY